MSNDAVPNVDAIIEGFPQQLTKIRGLPTYTTLNSMRQALYRNANSFSSTLGGGAHGYLGALMSTPKYLAATAPNNVPFVTPNFPGYIPVVIGTAAAIAAQTRQHKEDLRKWREYENVTKALRKQLIGVIEPAYLTHFEDEYSGFNKVEVKDLINYLFQTYGHISSMDLIENNRKFESDWDPSETWQTVMTRIKQCCDYAHDAGRPYSEAQKLSKAHALVYNTGLYFDTLDKWDELPAVNQTYQQFCTNITQAQNRLRNKKTTKQHGYGLAVEQMQEITENFCNLVSNDRQEKENDRAIITALRQEMAEMKALIAALQHTPQPSNTPQPSYTPQPNPRTPFQRRRTPLDSEGYCWSHGYLVAANHNSKTCRTKKPGHNNEATRQNNLGGSQVGKPQA
jgi:hypothetical protein